MLLGVYVVTRPRPSGADGAALAASILPDPAQGCLADLHGPYISSTVTPVSVRAPMILVYREQGLNSAKQPPVSVAGPVNRLSHSFRSAKQR